MELGGEAVAILRVDDVVALPGPGLVAGSATLASKGEAIDAFVTTTLKAMAAIADDPEAGLVAAIAAVPELASSRDAQLAVLRATIDSWTGPVQAANGLGALDRDGWSASLEYLTGLGLVPNRVTVDDLLQEKFSRSSYRVAR
jgi:ABC-type nitrate/sulfonate/bicarbonate transport system substrate-binding protein